VTNSTNFSTKYCKIYTNESEGEQSKEHAIEFIVQGLDSTIRKTKMKDRRNFFTYFNQHYQKVRLAPAGVLSQEEL
jgi:hypothetical protein